MLLLVILCVLSQKKSFRESLEHIFLLRGTKKYSFLHLSHLGKLKKGRCGCVICSPSTPLPSTLISPTCTCRALSLVKPPPLLQTLSWFSRRRHRVTSGQLCFLRYWASGDICEMTSQHWGTICEQRNRPR